MVSHFFATPRMPTSAANETGCTEPVRREPRHVATLVPFPSAGVRPPRMDPTPGGGSAEILLFLGVRYERRTS